MTVAPPARAHVIAVIVATTAALIGRAWLQLELLADGLPKDYAADLSYLVVPPILLILLASVVNKDRIFLARQFHYSGISLSVVIEAMLVGVLLRIAAWAKLIAGVSFGFYQSNDPFAIVGPQFAFHCASPHAIFLGFVVMAVMIPIIEEVTHRAYIQSALHHLGPFVAILIAAFTFTIFHPLASWSFAFIAGLAFGLQYWKSGSLWPSIISHATVNGLIQIDWRCLRAHWNPPASDLPMWDAGIASVLVLVLSILSVVHLLRRKKTGAQHAPRP